MPKHEHSKRSLAHEAMLDLPLKTPVEPWVISKPFNLSAQDLTTIVNGNECINVAYVTNVRFPKMTSITRIADPEKNRCALCTRNPHVDGKDERKFICVRAIKP